MGRAFVHAATGGVYTRPMASSAAVGEPTFNDVARLIAGNAPIPSWLPAAMEHFSARLMFARRLEEGQPGRTDMKRRLRLVSDAARCLLGVIKDMPTLGQLDYAGPDAVSAADLNALEHLLVDLRDRAGRAEKTIPEGGGRGRAFAGCSASPMDHCAMLISEAWCIVHDERPKPGNQIAQQAASALWRASGGIEKGWGSSTSGWRKHLQAIELYDEERRRTHSLLEQYCTLSGRTGAD
jgi:hypothetical protein